MARLQPQVALLLTSLLVTVFSAGLIAVGFLVGSSTADKTFRKEFRNAWSAATLGRMLDAEEEVEVSQAYEDPFEALEHLEEYAWSPRNVPTPFVGSAPEPGRHHNASINSLQFRSRAEVGVPKPSDEWRIFLTGGSTAFSSGAPDEDRTIAGYLERILNEEASGGTDYRVFTVANPSWASTHERIMIENVLSDLEPDLVISLSGVNDVHWGDLGRNVLWFRTYQDQHFFSVLDGTYRAFGQQGLTDVERTARENVDPATVARRLEKNVRLASEALSMSDSGYLFALQPSLYETGKALSEREAGRLKEEKQDYFVQCLAAVRSRLVQVDRVPFAFADLTDLYDGMAASDEIFLDSYHFGDRGNRMIAERLAAWVRDRRTVDPTSEPGSLIASE